MFSTHTSIFSTTMTIETVLLSILAFPTAFWLVAYLLPQIFMVLRPVPDLKKRYNAEWALVTGSGSGIGKILADFNCTVLCSSSSRLQLVWHTHSNISRSFHFHSLNFSAQINVNRQSTCSQTSNPRSKCCPCLLGRRAPQKHNEAIKGTISQTSIPIRGCNILSRH